MRILFFTFGLKTSSVALWNELVQILYRLSALCEPVQIRNKVSFKDVFLQKQFIYKNANYGSLKSGSFFPHLAKISSVTLQNELVRNFYHPRALCERQFWCNSISTVFQKCISKMGLFPYKCPKVEREKRF